MPIRYPIGNAGRICRSEVHWGEVRSQAVYLGLIHLDSTEGRGLDEIIQGMSMVKTEQRFRDRASERYGVIKKARIWESRRPEFSILSLSWINKSPLLL